MPRYPDTSRHAIGLSDSIYSALLARARSKDEHVYELHVGDTYREPIEAARAEHQRTSEHPRMHAYAPVQGEPTLLEAIVRKVMRRTNVTLDRERIQVMAGATSGLSIVSQTLFDVGDEVLIPSPFWPLFRGIVASQGAVPVQVPFFTQLEDRSFDPEAALRRAITERTSAIYVNAINNPTGQVLSVEILDGIIALAERFDLWILWDEAYEDLWFTEHAPEPGWVRRGAESRSIVCHTLSKSYGLAGARVGFTHGPDAVMRRVRSMQTFHTYCASRPMQFAAANALNEGDAWVEESRELYVKAARRTANVLRIKEPAGSTFVFFDASRFFRAGETLLGFLERCADRGILLTPGTACGTHYETWARLCYTAVSPERLEEALSRLEGVLNL